MLSRFYVGPMHYVFRIMYIYTSQIRMGIAYCAQYFSMFTCDFIIIYLFIFILYDE